MKANVDIRNAAKENGVMLWEIAEKLGIYDGNLSRKLRHELPPEEKAQIFAVIDEISAAKQESEATVNG